MIYIIYIKIFIYYKKKIFLNYYMKKSGYQIDKFDSFKYFLINHIGLLRIVFEISYHFVYVTVRETIIGK